MKVRSFVQDPSAPWVWLLEVEGDEQLYAVHRNALMEKLGGQQLAAGDEITFQASRALTYPQRPEIKFVLNISRAPKIPLVSD